MLADAASLLLGLFALAAFVFAFGDWLLDTINAGLDYRQTRRLTRRVQHERQDPDR